MVSRLYSFSGHWARKMGGGRLKEVSRVLLIDGFSCCLVLEVFDAVTLYAELDSVASLAESRTCIRTESVLLSSEISTRSKISSKSWNFIRLRVFIKVVKFHQNLVISSDMSITLRVNKYHRRLEISSVMRNFIWGWLLSESKISSGTRNSSIVF